jgi:predicted O-methyltransferase YrrM
MLLIIFFFFFDMYKRLIALKEIKDTAPLLDFLYNFRCFRQELDNYILSPKTSTTEKLARELNDFFLIASEVVLAAELLANNHSFDYIVNNHYIFADFKLKLKSFSAIASTNKIKTIAFIGCGSCPTAAMAASVAIPNANIIAIDIDANSLNTAKKLWEKFDFAKKCDFVCTQGEDFDFYDVDMLYVPCFVAAKNEILSRYLEKNDIAFVENPIPSYQIFYTSIAEHLLEKLTVISCNAPNPKGNINHELLCLRKILV